MFYLGLLWCLIFGLFEWYGVASLGALLCIISIFQPFLFGGGGSSSDRGRDMGED